MNASRDDNGVPTLICVSSVNGTDIINVQVNATNHGLEVDDNTTGTDYGPSNALHDGNNVPTWMGVSSADGVTPVVIYADSSGNLLVDSS